MLPVKVRKQYEQTVVIDWLLNTISIFEWIWSNREDFVVVCHLTARD